MLPSFEVILVLNWTGDDGNFHSWVKRKLRHVGDSFMLCNCEKVKYWQRESQSLFYVILQLVINFHFCGLCCSAHYKPVLQFHHSRSYKKVVRVKKCSHPALRRSDCLNLDLMNAKQPKLVNSPSLFSWSSPKASTDITAASRWHQHPWQ